MSIMVCIGDGIISMECEDVKNTNPLHQPKSWIFGPSAHPEKILYEMMKKNTSSTGQRYNFFFPFIFSPLAMNDLKGPNFIMGNQCLKNRMMDIIILSYVGCTCNFLLFLIFTIDSSYTSANCSHFSLSFSSQLNNLSNSLLYYGISKKTEIH